MNAAWWILRSLFGNLLTSNPKKVGLSVVKIHLRDLPDLLQCCRESCPHGAVLAEKKEIIYVADQEAYNRSVGLLGPTIFDDAPNL